MNPVDKSPASLVTLPEVEPESCESVVRFGAAADADSNIQGQPLERLVEDAQQDNKSTDTKMVSVEDDESRAVANKTPVSDRQTLGTDLIEAQQPQLVTDGLQPVSEAQPVLVASSTALDTFASSAPDVIMSNEQSTDYQRSEESNKLHQLDYQNNYNQVVGESGEHFEQYQNQANHEEAQLNQYFLAEQHTHQQHDDFMPTLVGQYQDQNNNHNQYQSAYAEEQNVKHYQQSQQHQYQNSGGVQVSHYQPAYFHVNAALQEPTRQLYVDQHQHQHQHQHLNQHQHHHQHQLQHQHRQHHQIGYRLEPQVEFANGQSQNLADQNSSTRMDYEQHTNLDMNNNQIIPTTGVYLDVSEQRKHNETCIVSPLSDNHEEAQLARADRNYAHANSKYTNSGPQTIAYLPGPDGFTYVDTKLHPSSYQTENYIPASSDYFNQSEDHLRLATSEDYQLVNMSSNSFDEPIEKSYQVLSSSSAISVIGYPDDQAQFSNQQHLDEMMFRSSLRNNQSSHEQSYYGLQTNQCMSVSSDLPVVSKLYDPIAEISPCLEATATSDDDEDYADEEEDEDEDYNPSVERKSRRVVHSATSASGASLGCSPETLRILRNFIERRLRARNHQKSINSTTPKHFFNPSMGSSSESAMESTTAMMSADQQTETMLEMQPCSSSSQLSVVATPVESEPINGAVGKASSLYSMSSYTSCSSSSPPSTHSLNSSMDEPQERLEQSADLRPPPEEENRRLRSRIIVLSSCPSRTASSEEQSVELESSSNKRKLRCNSTPSRVSSDGDCRVLRKKSMK